MRVCVRAAVAAVLVVGVTNVVAGDRVDQAVEPRSMIVVPYQDAEFKPLDPSRPDGTAIAVLHGDPERGPSTMFMKMREGSGRLHVHTADYHLVVIEGTMKHWGEGEQEADAKPMTAGGYWFQRGGVAHGDSCLTDTCVMFISWSGARDSRVAGRP